MNDERFWKIVEFIDWPREDYKDIKAELLMELSPREIKGLRDGLGERTSKLRELFDEERERTGEDFYVSGDGLDDCVNHIVGLGEMAYTNCVECPGAIVGRYRAGEYTESFSYAIPGVNEVAKLSRDYYQFRSTKYADQFREIGNTDKFASEYKAVANRVADVLESFPYHYSSIARFKRAGEIEKETEEALLDRLIEYEEELSEDVRGVPVKNLISDYRTYFKKSENEL